jgi:signal transduction histidine kinase
VNDAELPTGRQQLADAALGAACLALAVAVHLGGTEAVPRNLDPSVSSVLLTALAVGPLVVRRRFPLLVLALTLLGLLALIATRNTVGVSTLGCTVAFYTVLAVGSRRQTAAALVLMGCGVAAGLLMRPVDLSAGGALVNLAVFTGAGVLGRGVRERRARFEADVVAAREREARSAADERLRITRELHDIIGHAMSVMVVQAGVAERLLDSDPARARSAVAQIGATGRRSLEEMRQVLGPLREQVEPGAALPRQPVPGLAALPTLTARVQAAGLRVDLVVEGPARPLPQALELAAYRVVQEALTNCLKHAGATRARVSVRYTDEALDVTVEDDGTRATVPQAGTGQGLVGMRERVAVHGGELVAGRVPGDGFRVEARLPVPVSHRPVHPEPAPAVQVPTPPGSKAAQ